MRINLLRTLFFAGVLAAGLLIPGCLYGFTEYGPHHRLSVEAGPVVPVGDMDTYYVEEGRHGALHDYYYYPGAEVYFDPIGVTWYWREGAGWHHGRDLPHHYRINEHDRVNFHTDARRPYDVHERVIHRRGNERRGHEERERRH